MLYQKFSSWYTQHYKALLVIPAIVFLISVGVFVNNVTSTGELFSKGIELSGGTIVTVHVEESLGRQFFESQGLSFREIRSYGSQDIIAVAIEAGNEMSQEEVVSLVEEQYPGAEYDVRNVGPAMGEAFLNNARFFITISFLLMGLILAAIFRQPIVAFTVILSGFLNVFEAAAFMTVFGVDLSAHTIGALLLLMGWSVDSEVLFDTKILKEVEGDPRERAVTAMVTAMTMSAAIFGALLALYFFTTSTIVREMALVLMLGAFFDIINTWFQSLSMVLWYAERRGESA